MYTILVCDDEKEIRENLVQEGFRVLKAYDGEEALEILQREEVHLLVLDLMMPKLDGIHAIMKIREDSSIPIIVLSAKTQDTDKILGLNLGADDYVAKPFSPLVLAARVKTLLKRSGAPADETESFGDLTVDERSRAVSVAGNPVELTPKEYELLVYFKNNRRVALSRETILNAVWGYDYFGDLRTVDTHIKKLRAKLGTCGTLIGTVRGYGYRFDAD